MNRIILILLVAFGFTAIAQPKPRNLTVGDRVPDIFIPKLINYKTRSSSLGDFKHQLLILDFWSINCSGCVAALPRMQALQQQFGDRVEILPVTYDPEAATLAFWKKNKYTKDLSIPSVVADKTLSAWFRHAGVPHEIWINKGVVVGITFADYVTAANIREILDGKTVSWPVKNDFIRPFNVKKPFLAIDPVQYSDPAGSVKYAAVFGYREQEVGVMPGIVRDSIRHTVRVYFVNNTVAGAYCYYWQQVRDPDHKGNEMNNPPASRMILEVKDPLQYAGYDQTKGYQNVWHRNHLFCFESVNPDTGQTKKAIYQATLRDLDYQLGMYGRFETRKVKCLVLVKTGSGAPAESSGGDPVFKRGDGHIILKNTSLKELVYRLNQYVGNPPVFDGSGYDGNVDMDLQAGSLTDLGGIRRSLQTYGFDLKEEDRELEMFVLTQTR